MTMVDARHSSSIEENGAIIPLGEAAGFVLTFEDGLTLYFAGDTALFGDMRLIARAVTGRSSRACRSATCSRWDPQQAAKACEWLGVKQVIPMHYGTFPALTGTPDMFRKRLPPGIEVLELQPGEDVGVACLTCRVIPYAGGDNRGYGISFDFCWPLAWRKLAFSPIPITRCGTSPGSS